MSIEPSRDAFEQKFMTGGGSLLRREKSVQQYHWVFLGLATLFLVGAIGGVAGAALGPVPWVVALVSFAPALLMGLLWTMFSVLRVHVTTEKLIVQLGPRGLHVPLGDIVSARVVPAPEGRYSGGRVRMGLDGRLQYSYMMTNASELVEVVFRRKGKEAAIELTSPDPHALVRSILGAKGGASSPRARVDMGAEEEVEVETAVGSAKREL